MHCKIRPQGFSEKESELLLIDVVWLALEVKKNFPKDLYDILFNETNEGLEFCGGALLGFSKGRPIVRAA